MNHGEPPRKIEVSAVRVRLSASARSGPMRVCAADHPSWPKPPQIRLRPTGSMALRRNRSTPRPTHPAAESPVTIGGAAPPHRRLLSCSTLQSKTHVPPMRYRSITADSCPARLRLSVFDRLIFPVREAQIGLPRAKYRSGDASGGRGSNPRPQAWEACALPTELPPRGCRYYAALGREPRAAFAAPSSGSERGTIDDAPSERPAWGPQVNRRGQRSSSGPLQLSTIATIGMIHLRFPRAPRGGAARTADTPRPDRGAPRGLAARRESVVPRLGNIWLCDAPFPHDVRKRSALCVGQADGAVSPAVLGDVKPLIGGRHQRAGAQPTVGAGGHAD
jgi:hypothetical protein